MRTRWLYLLVLLPCAALAQSTNAPLNEDYFHWIDRYEVKAGRVLPELFTSVKPYTRKSIASFVDTLNARDHAFSSRADLYNYEYLRNDNWEWSHAETNNSLKHLPLNVYPKKSDFAKVDLPEFDLHVSPVLYFGMGKDSRLSDKLYTNTRGIEIRGTVDKRIGFYSFLSDNQAIMPSYVQDGMQNSHVVPHEGFWKGFKKNGVDFFQARAYISFAISKHILMQFGQDRTFIGNGYRSLIFSDYSAPNLFLRTNVKVWKINYLFQINQLTADSYASGGGSVGTGSYPVKYMAFHHATINIGRKFNLGFFESVIFNAQDTVKKSSFNFNYVNPVIFYRAIEQQSGSPDNVIVGADFKWNLAKGISTYGQIVIDEFVLKEVKAGNGWWGNKFGGQFGVKYIDVAGIQNLDLQVEANVVRPYTYSHNTEYDNYSNYRQPLAHPLGANFVETVAIVRYQPFPKLNLIAKTFYTRIGRDAPGMNYGSEILKNNTTRASDYGNHIGQGVKNTIAFVDLNASYQLRHNLFIEVKETLRSSKSTSTFYNNNTSLTSVALRLNIARRAYDF